MAGNTQIQHQWRSRTVVAIFAVVTAAAMAANLKVYPFPMFYYGLFVLGMRHALRARRVRAPYVTAAYLLFGAFTVFELAWHALRGRMLPPLQGLALFPEVTAVCALGAVLLLGAAAVRRKFSPWYLLDALIFFNMLGPALAAPYRSTSLGCGGVTSNGLIFSRLESAHHFGVAFSPDGNTLYVSLRNPGSRLLTCSLRNGNCTSRGVSGGEIYRLITDPRRGEILAFMYPEPGETNMLEANYGHGAYCRFGIGPGGVLNAGQRVRIPAAFPVDAAFSPDARSLAVADKYGSLSIVDADTGRELAAHDFGNATLYRVAWDRAGRRVYVSMPSGRVQELDATARPTGRSVSVPFSAAGIAFSPDADMLYVTAPFLARTRFFDAHSLRQAGSLQSHYLVREIAAAPGRVLAGSYKSGRVDVFDTHTGTRIRQLRFGKMMRQLAVSPDGRRAAAVSYCGAFALDLE